MKSRQEIEKMIAELSENAFKVGLEKNNAESHDWVELAETYRKVLSRIEGKIDALRWVIED